MIELLLTLAFAGIAWYMGYRHGLSSKIDEVYMAVAMDPITELMERLNTLSRGMKLHCRHCGAETDTAVGEIKRTPVTAEDEARMERERPKMAENIILEEDTTENHAKECKCGECPKRTGPWGI